MSYPRKVHTLIVEDEDGPRRSYDLLFGRLQQQDPSSMAPPAFAVSFSDAERCLASSAIYHALILDMGLPPLNRQSAPEGVEPGMRLLDLAAKRDDHPIPVVIVISGRLGGSTDVPQLRSRLERDFWYGQFLNKGSGNTEAEIREGVRKAQEYCDVGIHLRDSGENLYPTLSPREVDLLRRCICKEGCIGVDLEWWSAEDCGTATERSRWKKILMGQFLLDGNLGLSNHVFFKFEPARNAEYVHSAATVASKKLRHVKKVVSCISHSRSLLVTESVCTARPIALDQFLSRDPAIVLSVLPAIVDDIVQQLEHLGASTEITKPVRDILWPHFRVEAIRKAMSRWMKPEFAKMADVEETFEALSSKSANVWVQVRQCNHGDLHARNVAIDTGVTPIRAFIFDTGAMSPAVNVRDLALLEVTALLFQTPGGEVSLVQACESLYGSTIEPPADLDLANGTPQMRNTRSLIAEIRRQVSVLCDPQVYALAVFDQALMELSGLAVQSTRNKIPNPFDAARLAAISAAWLRRIAPDLF